MPSLGYLLLIIAPFALGCGATAVKDPPGAGGADGGADAGADGGDTRVVGRACAKAADCGDGYDCNLEAPGGYCMPGAPGGPTACREPEQPCPAGSTCSPLPMHAISGVCLRSCAGPTDCRAGYVCSIVELFPGDSTSPRSPAPVCWTVCQPGADQTCNDSLTISSLHGVCEADGTCTCNGSFEKNPATGRCR